MLYQCIGIWCWGNGWCWIPNGGALAWMRYAWLMMVTVIFDIAEDEEAVNAWMSVW